MLLISATRTPKRDGRLASFVHKVDSLVWQVPVTDVPIGQIRRRYKSL